MELNDLGKSIREMSQEEGMNLIKRTRVSRNKRPKRKKKKRSSSGGGRRKKAPQNIDEIWAALNSEQQKELLKKMENKHDKEE